MPCRHSRSTTGRGPGAFSGQGGSSGSTSAHKSSFTIHGRVLTPSRTAESSHRSRPSRPLQQDRVTSSMCWRSPRRFWFTTVAWPITPMACVLASTRGTVPSTGRNTHPRRVGRITGARVMGSRRPPAERWILSFGSSRRRAAATTPDTLRQCASFRPRLPRARPEFEGGIRSSKGEGTELTAEWCPRHFRHPLYDCLPAQAAASGHQLQKGLT